MRSKYLYALLIPLIVFAWFGTLVMAKEFIAASAEVTLNGTPDLNFYEIEANSGGTLIINSIEWSTDQSNWVQLPAVTGSYGVDTLVIARLFYYDLPPGTNNIYFRAVDENTDTWPVGDLMVELTRPNFLSVILIPDGDLSGIVIQATEDNSGPEYVQTLEYRVDGGSWTPVPEEFGNYGTDFIAGRIYAADIECGSRLIEARAFDQNGLESPGNTYPSEQFDGTFNCGTGEITVNATDNGSYISVSGASTNISELQILSLEYNFDNGYWFSPSDLTIEPDGSAASGTVAGIPGAHTFYLRAVDQNSNYWPVAEYSINIPGGQHVIYQEDFENGVGTTIDQGVQQGPMTDTIGSEWDIAISYGRLRLQGGGFQYAGNGAATLDSVDGGGAQTDLVLTRDLSNYQTATDLELQFQYMWHHDNPALGDLNKVFIRASNTSEWIEANNLITNSVLGTYVAATIDIDSLLGATHPTSTFQVRFHFDAEGQAVSTTANGGFTIDDVALRGTLTGPAPDTTPGEINFTQSYSGIGGSRMVFTGNAFDSESTITNVSATFSVTNPNQAVASPINAAANDLFFDSNSEDFTITFDDHGNKLTDGATYDITITVTNSVNLTQDYVFTGVIDGVAPAIQTVSTLGQDRIDMTVIPNLNYTGTVVEADVNVANVQYRINDPIAVFDTGWVNTTPIDGAFDEPSEDFTFTISTLLPDGNQSVLVRTIDSVGNILGVFDESSSLQGEGQAIDRIVIDSVDTTAPDIQLQTIIPDPTIDPEPPLQGKVKDDTDEKTSNIQTIYYRVDGGSWLTMPPLDGANDSTEELFSLKLQGLALGAHTADVRVVDAAGNDTDAQSKNQSISFTLIAQDPNLNAINIVKTESFDDHSDHDIISSDLIWGNGVLRLKEAMAPTRETVLTGGLGPRYGNGYTDDNFKMVPSAAGGFWVYKDTGVFSYYNGGVEQSYTIGDFTGFTTAVGGGEVNRPEGDIEEVVVNGEYHVWIGAWNGLLGVNFGTSIADGPDSHIVYDGAPTVPVNLSSIEIDERNLPDYGIYFANDSGTGYFRPGDFGNSGDDQVVTGLIATGVNPKFFLDESTSDLWVGDPSNGIYRFNDAGTPLISADDSISNLPSKGGVFDFVKDKNSKIVYGYPGGIEVILNDQGTFALGDDEIAVLATYQNINDGGTNMTYLPGIYPVGSQFFVSTASGRMFYLSINDTYEDRFDDQFLDLNFNNDLFPAEITDFYMTGYNSMRVIVAGHGVYDYDLHRDFAVSGKASSEIDATIEGRLDADFITLDSVETVINAGGITYEVSNNGGLTWYPITVGGTVNFPTKDYRIKFRVNMTKGSTPVIGNISFSYSAYLTEDDRGFAIDIENEPETVLVGTNFSFSVNATDLLSNPVEGTQPVNIELRRLSDNTVIPGFSVNNAEIVNGQAVITNANANVLGTYYIRAYNDQGSAVSEPINFIGSVDNNNVTVIPSLVFTSNKYKVKKGEEFTLNWTSSHFSILRLTSEDKNYGAVATNGSTTLTLDKTTLFFLDGEGAYGNLRATLTVEVTPDEELVSLSTEAPSVVIFEAEKISETNTRALYRVTWETENATSVEIIGIGKDLALSGSTEIYIDQDTQLELVATNPNGEDRQILNLNFTGPNERMDANALIPAGLAAVLTAFTALYTLSFAGGTPFALREISSRFGILYGILIPKKKKYWGFIYDINKYKPIPFAYISVFKDKEMITRAISDEEGKYGILLEKSGTYRIEVKAQGYDLFSKEFNIEKVGASVEFLEDIPLSQIGKNPSLVNKLRFYYKAELIKTVRVILTVLMLIGFFYSLYVFSLFPNIINSLILVAYFGLFLINFLQLATSLILSRLGKVIDVDTEKGLPGVSVRFYRGAKQVGVYLTNSQGRMKIRLSKGTYWCLANKEGYVMSEITDAGSKDIEVTERGYISKDIAMKKSEVKKSSLAELVKVRTMQNPFS